MKICIDSDETGRQFQSEIIRHLTEMGHTVTPLNYTLGNHYPDMTLRLTQAVRRGYYERGITICGTGQGAAMMANNVRGIFASPCYHAEWAPKLARNYNAQVICLGCQLNTIDEMKAIVKAYIDTAFEFRSNTVRMRELEATL